VEERVNPGAGATTSDTGNFPRTAAWRSIQEGFWATGDASRTQEALTAALDWVISAAYGVTVGQAVPQGAALVACGAYGRGETFPYSEVEAVLLAESGKQAQSVKTLLPDFAGRLWQAGSRVNLRVLSVAEYPEAMGNHRGPVYSLLNPRFVVGDPEVVDRVQAKLPSFLAANAQKMAERLCHLAAERHARYRNTPHHAEPSVKETPGGLQDARLLDTLEILDPDRFGRNGAPNDAVAMISSARCFLHYYLGRDSNILEFEAQEAWTGLRFAPGKSPAECMRVYFQSATAIFHEARRKIESGENHRTSLLLDNFREYRSRLSNDEFTVSREKLLLRNPSRLAVDPGLAVRMLEFISRHGVAAAPETERRLEASRSTITDHFARPQPLWATLKVVLECSYPSMALRALESAGLMPAIFPEWSFIEHQVLPDSEHTYTTDEYVLSTIESIVGLHAAPTPELQRFAQLLAETDDLPLLVFALLFHQIGAGEMDPLLAASERARVAATRIQMPPEALRTVEFLIRHQTDLSDAVSGRDMNDPATVRVIAERAGTTERLKLLTLLSYARIVAASDGSKIPWRLEQLWRAYSIVQHELMCELETDRIQQAPSHLCANAEFFRGFPSRYLRTHSQAEIETHLHLFERSRPTGVAVQQDTMGTAYRLTIVARDKPSLFASFAGAISSFGLDILMAEAFSNDGRVILDTFVFSDPKRLLQQNPGESDRLTDLIQRIALGKTDVQRLMRGRKLSSTGKRSLAPQVQFDSEACPTATLVEIATEDRPGLLYSLANVFSTSACNIDIVLVDTKGRRAIDVFYVAQEGRKLSMEAQSILRERLLAAC
jgi:[protein-PII] uridylyltransferase